LESPGTLARSDRRDRPARRVTPETRVQLAARDRRGIPDPRVRDRLGLLEIPDLLALLATPDRRGRLATLG